MSAAGQGGGRPNILWFITDDTDHSMLGYSGGQVLTPNIDRIAHRGVQCTNFFTSTPVCTPARYNCLTGHYAGSCPGDGFRSDTPSDEPYRVMWNTDLLPEREKCLGHALQAGGYVTGYTGKWHCGPGAGKLGVNDFQPDDDPADPEVEAKLQERQRAICEQVRKNGFDYAASIIWGNTDGRPVKRLHEHNLEWIAKGALDFLDEHGDGDRPFFLQVATSTIHGPSHVMSLLADERLTGAGYLDDHVGCMPPRLSVLRRLEDAAHISITHRTAGALWTDDLVGTVMDRLREVGAGEDTIVIFTTDHGALDGKATCHHGGSHIPFVLQWPDRVPAGSMCEEPIQNIDLVPTLLEAAGVEPPEEMHLDGGSALPWLLGEKRDEALHEDLYFEWGYARAVATERWKYIAFRYPERLLEEMKSGQVEKAYDQGGRMGALLSTRRYRNYWDADQLFDLVNDPEEQCNLADCPDYADVLAEMKDRLRGYLEKFDRPYPDLDEVDEFRHSERYRELCRRTASGDPNQWEWYRKGWY